MVIACIFLWVSWTSSYKFQCSEFRTTFIPSVSLWDAPPFFPSYYYLSRYFLQIIFSFPLFFTPRKRFFHFFLVLVGHEATVLGQPSSNCEADGRWSGKRTGWFKISIDCVVVWYRNVLRHGSEQTNNFDAGDFGSWSKSSFVYVMQTVYTFIWMVVYYSSISGDDPQHSLFLNTNVIQVQLYGFSSIHRDSQQEGYFSEIHDILITVLLLLLHTVLRNNAYLELLKVIPFYPIPNYFLSSFLLFIAFL